jgi:hypothetical protein
MTTHIYLIPMALFFPILFESVKLPSIRQVGRAAMAIKSILARFVVSMSNLWQATRKRALGPGRAIPGRVSYDSLLHRQQRRIYSAMAIAATRAHTSDD